MRDSIVANAGALVSPRGSPPRLLDVRRGRPMTVKYPGGLNRTLSDCHQDKVADWRGGAGGILFLVIIIIERVPMQERVSATSGPFPFPAHLIAAMKKGGEPKVTWSGAYSPFQRRMKNVLISSSNLPPYPSKNAVCVTV